MRFLETLLIVFAAIYVAQLVIAALILAALMLFMFCLWKRPKEALVLGLTALAIIFISRPIGLALVTVVVAGCLAWTLLKARVARRRQRKCCIRARLPDF